MNRGLREIATAKGLTTVQQARLFVMTSFASADALIACWDNKDHWNFWRPQTAIREAANDGNPATSPDGGWLSLFATPGYSDESVRATTATRPASGRAPGRSSGPTRCRSRSRVPGSRPIRRARPPINPIGVAGSTRNYTRFTDVIRDTIEGRILTGFHFRTADVARRLDRQEGRPVGRQALLRAHRAEAGRAST